MWGQGLVGRAASSGRTVKLDYSTNVTRDEGADEMETDEESGKWAFTINATPSGSVLCMPIYDTENGKVVAVLQAIKKEVRAKFTDDDSKVGIK